MANNGLISDATYYFAELSYIDNNGVRKTKEYTVSKYYSQRRQVSIIQKLHLFNFEYHTLKTDKWVNGEIINACATLQEPDWVDSIFISTRETFTLFNDDWRGIPGENWTMFTMTFPTTGKIFMPYLCRAHWRLFLVDIDNKVLSLIDPFYVTPQQLEPEAQRLLNHIDRYVNLCQERYIQNVFTEARGEEKWAFAWFTSNRPFQRSSDSNNCGVYVMYYMDVIGRNIGSFSNGFNLNDYRMKMAQLLLEKSDDMSSVCIYCFSEKKNDKVICKMCKRFAHFDCIENFDDICELCQSYQRNSIQNVRLML